VLDQNPECARVVAQVDESLRAIKLHIITYQLQLLRLARRKQGEITDLPKDGEEK